MEDKKKEALKDNTTLFIIHLALTAVCFVLWLVIKADWNFVFLIVGVIWFFVSFYTLFNGIVRINRSFCPECHTEYDYDKYDITWYEEDIIESGNKAISTVIFKCVCPKCGDVVTFSKSFVHAVYDKEKDSWEHRDAHEWAKKLFWLE